MLLRQHPLLPFTRALGWTTRRLADPRLWLPFLLLGVLKGLLLAALARLDVVPDHVVAALLTIAPGLEPTLTYPDLLLNLPDLARYVDLLLFVTLGAVVHGWAIVYLARTWTHEPLALLPDARRGVARLASLWLLSISVAAVPFAARTAAAVIGEPELGTWCALGAGLAVQALLFSAAAFVVIDGSSPWRSIKRSTQVLTTYPFAVPAAMLFLAAIHAPVLALRAPALMAGAHRNPDWILAALLGQIPADLLGAFFAAGLAARFALSSPVRYEVRRQTL